jgi:hypothetical protein
MDIRFTLHAEEKLLRLIKVGITKEKVVETLKRPERVLEGYWGRKIAQGNLAGDLILRVVYEETAEEILIITVYPAERRRYQ